jgi:hypothetical protein
MILPPFSKLFVNSNLNSPSSYCNAASPAADFLMRVSWIKDVVRAVLSLNAVSIIHGDVKYNNVMVTEQDGATLIDCGVARYVNGLRGTDAPAGVQTFKFNPETWWIAPEAHTPAEGPWTDCFSVAKLALQVLTGTVKPNHYFGDLVYHSRATAWRTNKPLHGELGQHWHRALCALETSCLAEDLTTRKGVSLLHIWHYLAAATTYCSHDCTAVSASPRRLPPLTLFTYRTSSSQVEMKTSRMAVEVLPGADLAVIEHPLQTKKARIK